jgi:hypothetical protein
MSNPTFCAEQTRPETCKLPYHSPSVREYGDVRELTLTAAQGPNFDGGGGANIYANDDETPSV